MNRHEIIVVAELFDGWEVFVLLEIIVRHGEI
jgi:hypothetical protein